MEGSSLLSCSSKSQFTFNLHISSSSLSSYSSSSSSLRNYTQFVSLRAKNRQLLSCARTSIVTCAAIAVQETLEKSRDSATTNSSKEFMPKIDKSGRFCSPRAARELALQIVYGSCLEGSDPIRLYEKRMNARREPGYEFNKATLLEYSHMSFGGPPVTTETVEEADELLSNDEKESALEVEVLSAPPKLVYSKLLLQFTRKLLVAVVEKWDTHVHVIDKVVPANWKDQPSARILELAILHLAMSEISVLGTRHQIVINEAVDLAKRFCDGAAPRIINGCLRTFVKDHKGSSTTKAVEAKQEEPVEV